MFNIMNESVYIGMIDQLQMEQSLTESLLQCDFNEIYGNRTGDSDLVQEANLAGIEKIKDFINYIIEKCNEALDKLRAFIRQHLNINKKLYAAKSKELDKFIKDHPDIKKFTCKSCKTFTGGAKVYDQLDNIAKSVMPVDLRAFFDVLTNVKTEEEKEKAVKMYNDKFSDIKKYLYGECASKSGSSVNDMKGLVDALVKFAIKDSKGDTIDLDDLRVAQKVMDVWADEMNAVSNAESDKVIKENKKLQKNIKSIKDSDDVVKVMKEISAELFPYINAVLQAQSKACAVIGQTAYSICSMAVLTNVKNPVDEATTDITLEFRQMISSIDEAGCKKESDIEEDEENEEDNGDDKATLEFRQMMSSIKESDEDEDTEDDKEEEDDTEEDEEDNGDDKATLEFRQMMSSIKESDEEEDEENEEDEEDTSVEESSIFSEYFDLD